MTTGAFAAIEADLARQGIVVAPEAQARIERYAELLAHWNRRINLVGTQEAQVLWQRHILDCLLLERVPRPPDLLHWADIGSGAGLPGVLLAIVHPAYQVTAIESVARKATFLGEATRTLALSNLSVLRADVRRLATAPGFRPYDAAVARAFGSLADLLTLGSALLRPGGELWAMKGRLWEREAAGLPPALLAPYETPPRVHAYRPASGGQAAVLVYRRHATRK